MNYTFYSRQIINQLTYITHRSVIIHWNAIAAKCSTNSKTNSFFLFANGWYMQAQHLTGWFCPFDKPILPIKTWLVHECSRFDLDIFDDLWLNVWPKDYIAQYLIRILNAKMYCEFYIILLAKRIRMTKSKGSECSVWKQKYFNIYIRIG